MLWGRPQSKSIRRFPMKTKRKRNRDLRGNHFTQQTRVAVWQKGKVVAGYDPAKYRMDSCDALIEWDEYGNTTVAQGWEIDHIKPVEKDGGDDLANLQPLQWQNNRGKGDNYPNWSCTVGS